MLIDSHQRKDGIVLWAIADPPSHFTEVFDCINASDLNLSIRWHDIVRKTLENG